MNERLYLRRKSGYMSPYPLSMFYGAWRAGIYFGNSPTSDPYVEVAGKLRRVPALGMRLFQPFNRYKRTQRGEYFLRGVR